jgi:dipeptidyl aminopeptidase/acylaminoacyl peptidase
MRKTLLLIILILGSGLSFFLFKKEAAFKKPLSLPDHSQDETQPLPLLAIASLREKEFKSSGFLTKELVSQNENYSTFMASFKAEDLTEYALVHVPQGQIPENGFPAVVVNHGYINPEVYSTLNSYQNTAAFFANSGFLVLKPDYRGHDQSEGAPREPLARIKYSLDVLFALEALKKENSVDQENIFMYGHSLGGEVVLRILEITDQVRAATLWAPAVTDFPENTFYFLRRGGEKELIDFEKEFHQIVSQTDYQSLSTLDNLALVNTPLIIHHGTNDQSVPLKWSETLVAKLKEAGKEVQFFTYENDNHNLAAHFSKVLEKDVAFFQENLTF